MLINKSTYEAIFSTQSTTFRCVGTVRLYIFTLFSYRRAHTQSTKQWLSILDEENVPVLICLTFADKLFAELMGENGDCDIEKIKTGIKEQLKVCVYFHFSSSKIIYETYGACAKI